MDDGVDLRLFGRVTKEVTGVAGRDLVAEDLTWLQEEKGVQPSPVKALRERHHHLARLLAEGHSDAHAAAITGYTISRVSILKSDQSFQNLVGFYKTQVMEKYLGTHEKLDAVASTALDIILERMEDEPEKISVNQAIEIAKLGADRTGHGPSSTQQVNVNVGFAQRLEEARKRAALKTIEILPNEE